MEKIDFFKSAILNCISLVYIMKNVEKGYKIYCGNKNSQEL